GVVQLDAVREPPFHAPAAGFVDGPRVGFDQQRVVGRVQLNVGRAQPLQLGHLVAVDGDHVGQEVVEGGIDVARALLGPEVGVEAGAGQGDFRDAGGAAAEVSEVFGGQMVAAF